MTTQLTVSDMMKYDLTDKMRMAPRVRFDYLVGSFDELYKIVDTSVVVTYVG
jgi:hypothetical protein